MPVTNEEVIWCYRAILGREPESEKSIQSHIKQKNLITLRNSFLNSTEFKIYIKSIIKNRNFMPLGLPKNSIEYAATSSQLEICLENIKSAWTHMGSIRPHHSVLTSDNFLPNNLSNNINEFISTGEAEANDIVNILTRHDFGSLSEKICVEYGCGVGRVSFGLAKRFNKLHAYDISLSHIEIAEEQAKSTNFLNCIFHLCSSDPLAPIENCDFFYSRIVFQHNPPPIIHQLIINALRSLKSNGIAIFQVPTYGVDYQYSLNTWLSIKDDFDMQMHCLPQAVIYNIISSENCELLEVREDDSTGGQFISNTFIIRKKLHRGLAE